MKTLGQKGQKPDDEQFIPLPHYFSLYSIVVIIVLSFTYTCGEIILFFLITSKASGADLLHVGKH